MGANTAKKVLGREARQRRVRAKILGTAERPRLCVFRSGKHIYAQLIDDDRGATLASTSSLGEKGSSMEDAKRVGLKAAECAKSRNISQVVFDRNGFLYHGRVKALAEGAREGGLIF
ncbi:MAG: 50S ribosomal protein L18 [Myxococcales bacterium]|nr:50S ribosomal protein L18 [Myxococcales bacterium]